ncbi:MAG: nucleotidyl transferase AbiEii/AbiGii toxin family protein [Candidatus Omnitrophica bacterium]|nr:nucleotidyl transferase AbiEii/AbiGii toxin family protein [Candidatus Omnitrophota bacterium]
MLDYLGIFKELNRKKIKYIVVGGMAVNFHGIPRATYDIDLLLYLEDKNLQKFLNLLREWGFKPKAPVGIMDFANQEKRLDWIKNKNMKAFNLMNPDWAIREIDIIINTPVNYERAEKNIEYRSLYGITIPTISIADLILMKSKSDRKQDKADIRNLKKLLK